MKSKKKLSEKVLAKKGLSIWNVELLVSNFSLNLTGVYANGFVISAYLVEVLNANSAFVGIMAALAMLPNTLLPFTSFIINKLKKKKTWKITEKEDAGRSSLCVCPCLTATFQMPHMFYICFKLQLKSNNDEKNLRKPEFDAWTN